MKAMIRTIAVGALLTLGSAAMAVTAAAAEPYIGTWKLNTAKSTYSPGPTPKSLTRVYTEKGDTSDMLITGVAADGSAISRHSAFKPDGKDYPYTGQADFDAMSVKRIDATHYETTLKKGGKVVGSTASTLSADGKTLTQVSKYVSAGGVPNSSTSVYDRQ